MLLMSEDKWLKKNKDKFKQIDEMAEKLEKDKKIQKAYLIFKAEKQGVKYKYNPKTHNFKIINSFLITNKKEMLQELEKRRGDLGKVNRSVKSALREWQAHNWLFEHDLFLEHTQDCDITMNEKRFRRLCYFFLSKLYRS